MQSGQWRPPIRRPLATSPSLVRVLGGEGITDPVWAKVKPGVRARWAQKSERDGGTGGSRGDGVVEWWCEDVKGELDIELAWEVESPQDVA